MEVKHWNDVLSLISLLLHSAYLKQESEMEYISNMKTLQVTDMQLENSFAKIW